MQLPTCSIHVKPHPTQIPADHNISSQSRPFRLPPCIPPRPGYVPPHGRTHSHTPHALTPRPPPPHPLLHERPERRYPRPRTRPDPPPTPGPPRRPLLPSPPPD